MATLAALITLPVVLVLALFTIPFLVVAAAVAAIARRITGQTTPWQDLVEYIDEIGWKPKGGLVAYGADNNGDPFALTTDPSGWRGPADLAESDILAFGDSFAFGFGAGDADFFGADGRTPKVKAIGAPGYNMVQSLLWMNRLAAQLRGKTVVWLIYPGNDLEDNLSPQMESYRTPFVRETTNGSWEIVTAHVNPEPWPFRLRRTNAQGFLQICRPSLLGTRAYKACAYLIEEAMHLCRAAGARLVIVTIPDLSPMQTKKFAQLLADAAIKEFDPTLPDERIAEICARFDLPFVPLADVLDVGDYLVNDVHWNARGHRRVAQALRDIDRDVRPTEPQPRATASSGPLHRRLREPVA